MTTKVSAASKNGKATANVKNDVKKKLTQKAIGLQLQKTVIVYHPKRIKVYH